MILYEFRVNNGAWISGENLGVSVASCTFSAGAPDEMVLTLDLGYDSPANFPYLAYVEMRRDGALHFAGNVATLPRSGSGESEGVSVVVQGPWSWFDNLPLLRSYSGISSEQEEDPDEDAMPAVGSSDTGTVYLFSDSAGEAIDTANAITTIVQYAIDQGAPVQLGDLPPDGLIPWDALTTDTTVAAALALVLRWHPDIDPWMDYSASPPRVNFTSRASMSSVVVDASGLADVEAVSILRRDDLRPSSVCIHYEVTERFNGEIYKHFINDEAGSGDCRDRGAVNVTVPIVGSNTQQQVQSVRTVRIPGIDDDEFSANGVSGRLWWRRKHPVLSHSALSSSGAFVIRTDSVEFTEVGDEESAVDPLTGEERTLDEEEDIEEYGRELTEGQIEGWMNVSARSLDISASIFLDTDAIGFDNLSDDDQEVISQAFGLVAPDGTMVDVSGTMRDVSGWPMARGIAQAIGTNAVTRNYKRITSYSGDEVLPTGLADAVFESLNMDTYEGDVTLLQEDAGGEFYMGRKFNISGGAGEWMSMDARVQQVTENYASGETTVSFGAPNHLAVQDLVELLQIGKVVPRVVAPDGADHELELSPATAGGYVTPINNYVPLGGGGGGGIVAPPSHPWRTTLSLDPDTGIYTASTRIGEVYESPLSPVMLADVAVDLGTVVDGDVVFLEYDYADLNAVSLTVRGIAGADFVAYDVDSDGLVILSRYPLSVIYQGESDPDALDDEGLPIQPPLLVRQIARSNLGGSIVCVDGLNVDSFRPL